MQDVRYDVRGPVLKEAERLIAEGHNVTKLNIGNPAPFDFEVPEEILAELLPKIKDAGGYSTSKGVLEAREAIVEYSTEKGISGVDVEDVYTGNGGSELIVMSLQGLLNDGDEVLVPAPDYPLWTAAVNLAGGRPVHYICDEESEWYPDIKDIESKITAKTKAIVIINPNNPTGAMYSPEILEQIIEIARSNSLVVMSDEIYDKIVYDGLQHVSTASLADDLLFLTLNGVSKTYRMAGFRGGWMVVSGNKSVAKEYIESLDVLSSMRLCSNVPAQLAIPIALRKSNSIQDLVKPGGRLCEQRDAVCDLLSSIPGISCVKPRGAFYIFPKIDPNVYPIKDDEKFALDLLMQEKVLIVHGTGFNWPEPDHFRLVFLAQTGLLAEAIGKIGRFLEEYEQE